MGDGVPPGFCILKDLTDPGDFPDFFGEPLNLYQSQLVFCFKR